LLRPRERVFTRNRKGNARTRGKKTRRILKNRNFNVTQTRLTSISRTIQSRNSVIKTVRFQRSSPPNSVARQPCRSFIWLHSASGMTVYPWISACDRLIILIDTSADSRTYRGATIYTGCLILGGPPNNFEGSDFQRKW